MTKLEVNMAVHIGLAIKKFLGKEGFVCTEPYAGDEGFYTIGIEEPDSEWKHSEMQFRAWPNKHPENGTGLFTIEWRCRHEQLNHSLGEWGDWNPVKTE